MAVEDDVHGLEEEAGFNAASNCIGMGSRSSSARNSICIIISIICISSSSSSSSAVLAVFRNHAYWHT